MSVDCMIKGCLSASMFLNVFYIYVFCNLMCARKPRLFRSRNLRTSCTIKVQIYAFYLRKILIFSQANI